MTTPQKISGVVLAVLSFVIAAGTGSIFPLIVGGVIIAALYFSKYEDE